MKKKKYGIELVKDNVKKEEVKEDKNVELIFYKPSVLSSYSGLLILIMFIVVCYVSVIKPEYLFWLLFGVVAVPILRRNFNYFSVIILSLSLIICATLGIIIGGVSEIIIMTHHLTKPMVMGIAIFGLIYITLIAFYKKFKFIDSLNIVLFYFLILVTTYPIYIICLFVGSLFGFLGVTLLQILIYCLFALPIVMALYFIFGKKRKL